jgi:hypothetical protein
LADRELGTSDTANDRPLTFVLDGLGHDVGKVLHRGEGDTVIVASIQYEGSAFVEVDLGLKSMEMLG